MSSGNNEDGLELDHHLAEARRNGRRHMARYDAQQALGQVAFFVAIGVSFLGQLEASVIIRGLRLLYLWQKFCVRRGRNWARESGAIGFKLRFACLDSRLLCCRHRHKTAEQYCFLVIVPAIDLR